MNSFNKEYFENGIATKKSCYENYHWMPLRSFKEAIAFIEYSEITEESKVLDVGCAKGFLVRAMRGLNINAEGCDISEYALCFCGDKAWNANNENEWITRTDNYTHAVLKDVLEHCKVDELPELLKKIHNVAHKFTCVVPIGDNGKYLIDEYHKDPSHYIAESVEWWINTFFNNGWCLLKGCSHLLGIKDNWVRSSFGGGRDR